MYIWESYVRTQHEAQYLTFKLTITYIHINNMIRIFQAIISSMVHPSHILAWTLEARTKQLAMRYNMCIERNMFTKLSLMNTYFYLVTVKNIYFIGRSMIQAHWTTHKRKTILHTSDGEKRTNLFWELIVTWHINWDDP